MKALILQQPGGTEQLRLTDIPQPTLQPQEVLVQVKALSLNPVDIKTRTGTGVYGRLKTLDPLIIGWDIAGVITEVGADVTDLQVGDEVFGMVNFPGHGQAYAEYVAAPAAHLARKPQNLSYEEAAAATLAALTAWQALVDNAHVQTGQKVLIHAASGGVGHFAVQIAKHLGAHVIGTSSAKNREFVLSLGTDEHIDYRSQQFDELVSDVDFVLDPLGGDNTVRSLKVLKPGGTVISIVGGANEAVAAQAKAEGKQAYNILVKSDGAEMQQLADLLEKSVLKAHVSQTFGFDRMADAHAQIESGRTVGKVVVTL
ncbi:NADPH:quinone reductase [Catalinimonas alkaloidigena]|uniref:NADPH:quinone reductase n=1 Tax=Catalinimonas alkaloidigena TaxID=1075417 RepID=A0A1G9A7S4_9BACT|nr:NADP-dependent oxidoreductase [Catalinimonas alkaloidigena]SDK23432.1 NADPH:quinone reductase [Catalinimonas alkaloidigena]